VRRGGAIVIAFACALPSLAAADERGLPRTPGSAPLAPVLERPDVAIDLTGGAQLTGTLWSTRAGSLTIVEADGLVRVVDRRAMLSIRQVDPPAVVRRRGIGMLLVGGVLLGAGAAVLSFGLVVPIFDADARFVYVPAIVGGAAAIAGAVPLLVYGARRHTRSRAARALRTVARSGGLAPRFQGYRSGGRSSTWRQDEWEPSENEPQR
jgi:hypothetical protein